jgi:hypothetical protein
MPGSSSFGSLIASGLLLVFGTIGARADLVEYRYTGANYTTLQCGGPCVSQPYTLGDRITGNLVVDTSILWETFTISGVFYNVYYRSASYSFSDGAFTYNQNNTPQFYLPHGTNNFFESFLTVNATTQKVVSWIVTGRLGLPGYAAAPGFQTQASYAGFSNTSDSGEDDAGYADATNNTGAWNFNLPGTWSDPIAVSAVPEPKTWSMIILGFCSLGLMAYRRNYRI